MVHFFHSLLCFVFSRIFSSDQVVVPFVPSTRQLHTALYRRIERKIERESAHQSQTALVKLCNLINIDTCQFLSNEIFFFVLVVLFRGILCVCVCCVVWRIGYCIHGLFADEQATQSFRNTQCNALSISSSKTVWVELLFDGFDGWKKKDDIENYF